MTAAGSAPSPIDLHSHSTASDGTDSPTELVARAQRRGLRTLALTDHDSTEGLTAAIDAGRRLGVTVVPGVELSTDGDVGELHMLGYFIDPTQKSFRETLRRLRDGRSRRAERIVEQLNEAGVPVALLDVQRLAAGGAVGRAHVARVLVADGRAASLDEAFSRYLVPGRPGYVPRPRLSPTEAIQLIHAAGGAAVLAHPRSVANLEAELATLRAAALDGLEAYYAAYSVEEQAALAEIARRACLLTTGGSDFHGVGERDGSELGAVRLPTDVVDRLAAAASRWVR